MDMGPVTRSLILLNVGIYAVQSMAGYEMVAHFALWPIGRFEVDGLDAEVGFRVWQLITYAFLHGNLLHLFTNMLALYMFGRDIERQLGTQGFLGLYGAAVLSAALTQLLVVSLSTNAQPYPTIGASGGVFGVLLAFGMLFPRRMILLLFPPIPMPAWLFVLAYGLLELTQGVLGTAAGIAHFAHLGGMLGGYLVLRKWRQRGT
jgi:membrane associated rhomboid family serine protease